VETSELPGLPDQVEFESDQEEVLTETEVDDFEPREDSLTEQDFEEEEIVPTQTDEWQPESEVEAVEEEEAEPELQAVETPSSPPPDSPQSIFETAKEAAEKGELADALVGFNKLVKKGKLVNEVIEEVSETLRRHPVNVEFWQLLGDSYMRIDDLQQALDAYTKAEELLR
jgi:tetratricopeptide (TPR) repeat protein